MHFSHARRLAVCLNTNRGRSILSTLSFVLCSSMEITSACPIVLKLFFYQFEFKAFNVHFYEIDFFISLRASKFSGVSVMKLYFLPQKLISFSPGFATPILRAITFTHPFLSTLIFNIS